MIGARMKILGSMGFTVLVASAVPALAGELKGEAKYETLRIEGTLAKNLTIQLKVATGPVETLPREEMYARFEHEGWIPDRLKGLFRPVTEVSLRINGKAVRIRQSTFAYLYSPNRGRIWTAKGSIYCEIEGGDASESYTVSFKLAPSRWQKGQFQIVERTLWGGAGYPKRLEERTIFHYHNTE